MHTDHSQVIGIAVWYGSFAHQRRDDRNLRFFYKGTQIAGRIGKDDATTGQKQRLVCGSQCFYGLGDMVFLTDIAAAVPPQMDRFRIFEIQCSIEYIFSDIDQDRTRPARRGDVKGFFQDMRQFFHVFYQVIMLGNRRRYAGNVGFLEGITANQAGGDLTADDDQRNGIHVGCRNARNHVTDTGTRCSKADSCFSRRPGIAIGCMDSTLFMTGKNVRKFCFIQFIV